MKIPTFVLFVVAAAQWLKSSALTFPAVEQRPGTPVEREIRYDSLPSKYQLTLEQQQLVRVARETADTDKHRVRKYDLKIKKIGRGFITINHANEPDTPPLPTRSV